MNPNSLNPFNLHGPAFLAFYIALMVITLWALKRWLRVFEGRAGTPPPRFDDPYLIAYLRGGVEEAARVATVSLIDRGLLCSKDNYITVRNGKVGDLARRDIEKAVLKAYREGGDGSTVLKDAATQRACEPYRELLERHGLLAGAGAIAQRSTAVAVAAALLLGTAVVRVSEALIHGRTNVLFLVALGLVSALLLWAQWRRRLTGAGDAALADLQTLFARLKARATSLERGGASNEMAMLAAVFGLAALPTAVFPFVEQIYPKPAASDSSSSGGDSSSSCGSSCGGGCGGGGCGGE